MPKYSIDIVGQINKSYYINADDEDEAIEEAQERFKRDFYIQHLSPNRFPDEAEFDSIESTNCKEETK